LGGKFSFFTKSEDNLDTRVLYHEMVGLKGFAEIQLDLLDKFITILADQKNL
jgi:hypothetical protein